VAGHGDGIVWVKPSIKSAIRASHKAGKKK
jgi:hypothetical protein